MRIKRSDIRKNVVKRILRCGRSQRKASAPKVEDLENYARRRDLNALH